MKDFLNNEDGDITVSFSLLMPFVIFYFLWVVSSWQARYIQLQTKAVLDFAVLGGATSGIAEKSDVSSSQASCYIPVKDISDTSVNEYGSDIAEELVMINAKNTLPASVAEQLIEKTHNYWDSDVEIQYQLGGIMHLKVQNIQYRHLIPGFGSWNFEIESTAKCDPK